MLPVFAICDLETDYAIRFMEYLNTRKLPFEVQMFTSTAPLLDYGRKKHIELLLISEKAMCEDVRALQVGKLLLLSEDRERREDEYPLVYKYQAASGVVREVLDCYSAEQRALVRPAGVPLKGRQISVYGLRDPITQMLFTITYGQLLAEKESVLYVNLQKHGALRRILEEDSAGDLGDLLYLFRTGQSGWSFRMSGMLGRIGKMEYVPAPFCAEDLGEITGEEWLSFLNLLQAACGHAVLLLDLGDAVRGLPGILQQSSTCLFLKGKDPFCPKLAQTMEAAWELDPAKATWLAPPSPGEIREGRWFLESLPQTAFGAFVRKGTGL